MKNFATQTLAVNTCINVDNMFSLHAADKKHKK